MKPLQIAEKLVHSLSSLEFGPPVTHIYNPLEYAALPHAAYLQRYATRRKSVLFLGMNPGPWGMAQTGVPFGAVPWVRDWLEITAEVQKPVCEHPKRPIDGFACRRIEVSGERVWGWAQKTFGTAERFFERFYVHNYCPLTFMEESGKNRTPDKLPRSERLPLYAACDAALRDMVAHLQPDWVVGIGAFAEARAMEALVEVNVQVGRILHPSPSSPLANQGWAARAELDLQGLGITL